MKFHKFLSHTFHACVLWMGCLSCTAELPDGGLPSASNSEGLLQVTVPLTRTVPTTTQTGEHEATTDECKITSLWFLAYPTDGSEGETRVQKLDTEELTHEYKTFTLRLKHGTYRIYLVANVPQVAVYTNEDELKDIILTYKDGETVTLPNTEDGLPMFYQYKKDNSDTYTVKAEGNEAIYADLEYTCVKVRYTLLFDNSTNGVSSAFGDYTVKIDRIGMRRIADKAPLVPNVTIEGVTISTFDMDETGTTAFNGKYGTYVENDESVYNDTEPATPGQWAYRATFYLPEHLVTDEAKQTQMAIYATLYDNTNASRASLEYTIELGDTEGQTGDTPVRQLPRGRYYDITARITGVGDKIEATAAIRDWTLQTVEAELNGPYYLYVNQTRVGLEAGQEVTVPCTTDAPELTYESPKYTVGGKEIDIYQVTFNKGEASEYESFTVSINPQMPVISGAAQDESIGKYFYIVAGNLKKKILVDPLNLDPYLIVTPNLVTVYIAELGGAATHIVTYTYQTNLKNIQIVGDRYNYNLTTKADGNEFTATNGTEQLTVTDGTGTLVCTLQDPANNFKNSYTTNYTFTATGDGHTRTSTATLRIIPMATKYRLHFRPKNDNWDNPHIYVYEPLYTPLGAEVQIQSNPSGENAVKYGFTGCVTFKGWKDEGGPIGNDWPNNGEGDIVTADSGFNPLTDIDGNISSSSEEYYWEIDYCPDFRTDCCEFTKGVNRKWPGVKMKMDNENPGWYYFDLPLLAEPNQALIMFANGHGGPSTDDKSGNYRYPAHMDPGVPLYDYEDKDGWFLYDVGKGDKNEFVDDKPDIANFRPGTYRIWVNDNSYDKMHVWIPGGADYRTWNSPEESLQYDNDTSKKYYDIVVSSSWQPLSTINYKLYGGSQTDDLLVSFENFTKVTGKEYDYEISL